MFDRSVAPPFAQCTTWCASHQVDGREHPGNVQPPSRIHSAFNIFGGQSLSVLPTSRISPGVPSTIGINDASHARRRTVSGANRSPVNVDPLPVLSRRLSKSMVTNRVALSVTGTPSAAATPRRTISMSASPRRWSEPRRSGPPSVLGRGAARGPSAASRTADASGSRRSRYSLTPSSSTGWDSAVCRLSRSSRIWNSPWPPYVAMIRERSSRISLGPQSAAMSTKPCSTVSRASSVSLGSSLPNSASATAAFPTLTLPERQRLRGSPSWAPGTPARPERAGPPRPATLGQFSEDPVNR